MVEGESICGEFCIGGVTLVVAERVAVWTGLITEEGFCITGGDVLVI